MLTKTTSVHSQAHTFIDVKLHQPTLGQELVELGSLRVYYNINTIRNPKRSRAMLGARLGFAHYDSSYHSIAPICSPVLSCQSNHFPRETSKHCRDQTPCQTAKSEESRHDVMVLDEK